MRISTQSKIILFIVFVTGLLLLASFMIQQYSNQKQSQDTTADDLFGWKYPIAMFPDVGPESQNFIAYSDIRDPGGIPQGLPVRLKIPVIGVDSAIEDAFITPDGRMDVPAGSLNVAWFALGPHPGQVGSAVIGGHFGIDNGIPKVFYDINKLKEGDKVYIEDDAGQTLAFIVRRIELFDRNADATTVFTSNDGLSHLNLITCEGLWNQVDDSYPDRRVVFTDAIPTEGAIEVKNKTVSQLAVKPIAETDVKQEDPAEKEPELIKPPPSQIVIGSVKKLYATQVDGLVTSLLIISILLMTFKISKDNRSLQKSRKN